MSVKTENRCKEIISLFCVKNSKRKVYQHGLNKKKKKKMLGSTFQECYQIQ